MNNNRGNNNNRRRGRGNNRQNGGGQQLNRIDSRARGNAPQLLEKYRKLAHDAHLNGDRVTEEYYLQFAEHYFRVIADQRLRQEEQRGGRRDERYDGEGGDRGESDDGGEYAETEYQPYDQAAYQQRPPREERQPRDDRQDRPSRDDRPREDRPRRDDRPDRSERQERNFNRASEDAGEEALAAEAVAEPSFEPAENPFVRGNRGLKPRRDSGNREDRRPRHEDAEQDAGGEPEGLSLSLPPALSSRDKPEGEDVAEAKPKARRARKPKPEAGDGEPLEAVG